MWSLSSLKLNPLSQREIKDSSSSLISCLQKASEGFILNLQNLWWRVLAKNYECHKCLKVVLSNEALHNKEIKIITTSLHIYERIIFMYDFEDVTYQVLNMIKIFCEEYNIIHFLASTNAWISRESGAILNKIHCTRFVFFFKGQQES